MIHAGDPTNDYVDTAVRHVLLRQGVLGIKVKIMLPWDPAGKKGPRRHLPDHVNVLDPPDEVLHAQPFTEPGRDQQSAGVGMGVPPGGPRGAGGPIQPHM